MRYAATLDENQNVLSMHKTISAAKTAATKNGAKFIRPAWREQPPDNDSDLCEEYLYTEYRGWVLKVDLGNSGAFVSGF